MDISHLKTFLEVYRLRHFRKSAEKLYITQSAASARIKLLETQLGVQLFTRHKKLIEPTSAGHRFHKYAETVVTGWEHARQTVALPEEFVQSMSIGCLADVWHFFLNDWIGHIRPLFDDTALNLTIQNSQHISEMLTIGTLDLGFVFEPLDMPILQRQQLTTFQLTLFSTEENATLEAAFSEHYIKVDWGASFAYDHSQHFSLYPSASLQTDYGVMALNLLERFGGAAYFPSNIIAAPYHDLALYPIPHAPEFERHLYAVYRKDSQLHETIKQFLATIQVFLSKEKTCE